MKEVIIYEFDDVPVKVGKRVLYPVYNMKREGLSKDVNEWIGWISKLGRKYLELNEGFSGILYIIVWNTGWGTYEYVGKYDT